MAISTRPIRGMNHSVIPTWENGLDPDNGVLTIIRGALLSNASLFYSFFPYNYQEMTTKHYDYNHAL